jgi:hypothetical protein
MNEAIERLKQSQRRRLAYENAMSVSSYDRIPSQKQHFVIQCEGNHYNRFYDALERIELLKKKHHFFALCPATSENGLQQGSRHFEMASALCFVEQNVIVTDDLSPECLRYVHRLMFCDRECSDPASLAKRVQAYVAGATTNTTRVVLKIQCSPKRLELDLMQIMHGEEETAGESTSSSAGGIEVDCDFTASETKCTHLLQAVYCPLGGTLRWGLVDREFAEKNYLLGSCLKRRISDGLHVGGDNMGRPRPCRAYYKMSEIVDSFFPALGWELGLDNNKDNDGDGSGDGDDDDGGGGGSAGALAMDVGASPGGWSQFLAEAGYGTVLAVDPGLLNDDVIADKRIVHLPVVVEDPLVQARLKQEVTTGARARGLRMLVCDVNFSPWLAAGTLVQHCFPYLSGYGQCECCPCPSSTQCRNETSAPANVNANDHDGEATMGVRGSSKSSSTPPPPPPTNESVFVILTFKMLKHPRAHHIKNAEDECKLTISSAHRRASGKTCSCVCRCWAFHLLHLAANSTNERTLVAKLH